MRIDAGISQTYVQQRQQTSNPTPVATEAPNNTQESTDEAQPLNKVDFTNMTSQELFDWMNGEVLSGRMSLDESSPFLAMAVYIPAGGELSNTLDNTTRRNFLELGRGAIEFAKSRNDHDAQTRAEAVLETMQKYQIKPVSIDVRA